MKMKKIINQLKRWGAREYPKGLKISTFSNFAFVRFDVALENERWFERPFIGTGVFHDLRDLVNTSQVENGIDRIGGASIRQLYLALTPQATNLCNYQNIFLLQNPQFTFGDVNDIWLLNIPDFPCNI